jgi:hypothetical protein
MVVLGPVNFANAVPERLCVTLPTPNLGWLIIRWLDLVVHASLGIPRLCESAKPPATLPTRLVLDVCWMVLASEIPRSRLLDVPGFKSFATVRASPAGGLLRHHIVLSA